MLWSLGFATAVVVVACLCNVGPAAPTDLLVGFGVAAKFRILVSGGSEASNEAAQLDTAIFEKSGDINSGWLVGGHRLHRRSSDRSSKTAKSRLVGSQNRNV